MGVSFKIKKVLLDIFNENQKLGVTEISNILGISRTIIHKALKELIEENKIKKIGKPPHTKYLLINNQYRNIKINKIEVEKQFNPSFKDAKILNDIFYKFTAEGKLLKGFSGLEDWCNFRKLDIKEKTKNYLAIYNHIGILANSCGLLDARQIFGKHFEKVFLDKTFYADQYKWMEFGRGKLAEMTFFAKQSQNKKLILESIDEISLKLECLIKKEKFDAIAITPHSIERKNQLLLFLKDKLKDFGLPFINIIKYYPNNIAIPQKSLKTRQQRIQNARNTIFINDKKVKNYKKTFLIDDFVGSGSTLNETAKKLKDEGVKEVIGFAFVGNMDLSYELINEV